MPLLAEATDLTSVVLRSRTGMVSGSLAMEGPLAMRISSFLGDIKLSAARGSSWSSESSFIDSIY